MTSGLRVLSGITFLAALGFSSAAHSENLWVDRFEQAVPANLMNPMGGPAPAGWETSHFKDGVRDYAIVQEGKETFLRGKYIPKTDGKVIFKKIDWDLSKYPYFSWKWRVRKFATGSTVKESKKEDSTASVYITVRAGIRAYVIKYIWAESDSVGEGYSKGEWNPSGRLMATVIRSGGPLNEWQTEKRNLLEDYRKLYGKDPPNHQIRGVGIMTEGDNTKTDPEADYDEFQALTE